MSYLFLYPMSALAIFTILYGMGMFFTRVQSVRRGEIDARYFKLMQGAPSEIVVKTGQHFTNLFEVPVLFYAVCLAFIALELYSAAALVFAWLFFGARLVHAYIHTTRNRIIPRLTAFMAGVLSVLAMWVLLLCELWRRNG